MITFSEVADELHLRGILHGPGRPRSIASLIMESVSASAVSTSPSGRRRHHRQ
jgi:hypothetical protein